jgi:para-nitrobenzyl esterase
MSVQALMASPLARGFFHRVIAFSGSMFSGLNLLPALRNAATVKAEKVSEAEQRGLKLAQSIGASSLSELRARPAEELLKASTGGAPPFGVATVDGWFLPNDVPSIFAAGKQNDVPMMIGWDANEGESFSPATFRLDTFKDHVRDQYGAGAETFWSIYPAATEDQGRASYVRYVRDLGFAFPVRTWARIQHKTGKAPAFLFFFERTPPDEPDRGAHHGAELTYAFHNIRRSQRPFNVADEKLSDAMSAYLVHFATTGDPNGANLTNWPSYDDRRDELLALGERIEPRQVPNKAALDFFETTIGRNRQ